MTTYLLDTSILVRRLNPRSAQHTLALQAIEALRQRQEILCQTPQTVVEFWAVATRPLAANGLGLTVEVTEAERLNLEVLFPLLSDPPGLYARWVSLVNQFGVSGKPTHDARIAAAMLEQGLTHILTLNTADFQRFAPAGIIAVDPSAV